MKDDKMESLLNEKKNFIRHVLMNAPPGKVADLVSDLKTLFGTSVVIQNSIEEAVAAHSEKNYAIIPLSGDEYVITCEESKVGNSYLQPKLKSLLDVNHLKKKVNTTEDFEELSYPELLENYRKSCSAKLEEYVQAHYSNWNELQTINYPTVNINSKNGLSVKCCSSVYATEREGRFNLLLIVCCDRHYLKNFHASSWRSSWNVTFLTTDEEVLLNGTIDVVLTYFEDANINFKATKNFEKTVHVNNDVDTFSANILSAIRECENCALYELNEFLLHIDKELIKNTRKIIPFNGDKFDWKETYQDIPAQIKSAHACKCVCVDTRAYWKKLYL
ncbi:F-actin capping protein, alpha subunit, putative [Plasmodium vivax]|uniref:F-actin-capping protein subunit alpha n=4 Tax=Plasmodium vivax TaxID=5855 RepID=A5K974_PLAVS|nr:F-actin capping protein, alpha subunit, putative [Plasmodium vivax]EDL43946.1 F-actin capping protein, alpha subunit, putative [Plasmodium vivax]KMZ86170.1 F-actin capping protein, alpha subunit [Plasmodium vivax Brazil I]KMZ92533.1 F-actin capping protein, alpha subunit [Plasmodium vivax Mauritania I]KMZ99082.1 F-actin capping protein, alpha subunit [Plasmodium vivax North Korean]|eukprot:XP_001613673.1 F-actin capping protein, alpha subunit [Plasmodium vivax Sal-1]